MIKILKDICIVQPDFPKITEICVKMIRRIRDADGIKVRYSICFVKIRLLVVLESKGMFKRTQHVGSASCNIVGGDVAYNMLASFKHHVRDVG